MITLPHSTPNQLYKVFKTAENRFEKKDYKKSLDGYKKVLTMKPNKEIESLCHLKIGLSLQFLENYSDALAAFEKSLNIQKSFSGFFYRGILFLNLKKYKEAEDNLKQALKLNTNDNNAVIMYVNLGRVFLIQDKPKEAIKYLKSALDIKENDINALLLLAETHKQSNEQEQAKEVYEKLLSFKQNKDAVIGLSLIYLDEKQEQKAISLLKNYLQSHPDPELYNIKGDIHFSLHDYDNALLNFKKARKIDNSEKLLLREAQVLLALNRPDDAVQDVNNFINSHSESISAKLFLAELYVSKKDNIKASEVLNELIQSNPKIRTNAQYSHSVANVLVLNNELDKAEDFYINANELGLQDWNITKQLVLISIDKNQFDKALTNAERMFSLAENNSQLGHSYHLKAIIYYRQELYDNAVKVIEEGLNQLKKQKNEQYFILILLLAKTKLKLNLSSEAEKIVHDALKENNDLKKILESDSELSIFLK